MFWTEKNSLTTKTLGGVYQQKQILLPIKKGNYFNYFTAVQEAPGRFATGTIVKRYTSGQIIDVTVEITANHKGYFDFKVCPNEDFTRDRGQDCFDA